jgi:hypothetical protein
MAPESCVLMVNKMGADCHHGSSKLGDDCQHVSCKLAADFLFPIAIGHYFAH